MMANVKLSPDVIKSKMAKVNPGVFYSFVKFVHDVHTVNV